MALPSPLKTWIWISNQRSLFSSIVQSTREVLYGYKTGFLAMSGASVKGSSVGITTSMDTVDRWTSVAALGVSRGNRTTAATTWIVITLANMGAEILLANIDSGGGNGALIMFSPGAGFTISTTQCPSATDEVNLNVTGSTSFSITSSGANWDRIWNFGYSSDGTACIMSTARAGAICFVGFIQAATSAVISPSTFSPPVIGFSCVAGTGIGNTISSFLNMGGQGSWAGNARVFNGTANAVVALLGGGETYTATSSIQNRVTFFPELQGGGFLLPEISVWSETGTSRGKVCNVIDVWTGPPSPPAFDGVTYPFDNTHQLVQWGPLVVPWDGSIPVLA